jgi:hypothetical protein
LSKHRRDLFAEGVRNPEAQERIQAAFKRGFQTRAAEMNLARLLCASHRPKITPSRTSHTLSGAFTTPSSTTRIFGKLAKPRTVGWSECGLGMGMT